VSEMKYDGLTVDRHYYNRGEAKEYQRKLKSEGYKARLKISHGIFEVWSNRPKPIIEH